VKIRYILPLVFMGIFFLYADPYTDFQKIANFDASIKDLVSNPEHLNSETLYFLEGTLESMDLIETAPESFYAQAQFFSAEWLGDQEIRTYKIWLIFDKASFASRIPKSPAQKADSNTITVHTKGLVLAQYLETVRLDNGELAYVFRAHDFKTISNK